MFNKNLFLLNTHSGESATLSKDESDLTGIQLHFSE